MVSEHFRPPPRGGDTQKNTTHTKKRKASPVELSRELAAAAAANLKLIGIKSWREREREKESGKRRAVERDVIGRQIACVRHKRRQRDTRHPRELHNIPAHNTMSACVRLVCRCFQLAHNKTNDVLLSLSNGEICAQIQKYVN